MKSGWKNKLGWILGLVAFMGLSVLSTLLVPKVSTDKLIESTIQKLRLQGMRIRWEEIIPRPGSNSAAQFGPIRDYYAGIMRTDFNNYLDNPARFIPVPENGHALLNRQLPWCLFNTNRLAWGNSVASFQGRVPALNAARDALLTGAIQIDYPRHGEYQYDSPEENQLGMVRQLASDIQRRMAWAMHLNQTNEVMADLRAEVAVTIALNQSPVFYAQNYRVYNWNQTYVHLWQAMQMTNWPESELSQLQAALEECNFLTNLPDAVAIQIPLTLENFHTALKDKDNQPGLNTLVRTIWDSPKDAGQITGEYLRIEHYLKGGISQDLSQLVNTWVEMEKEMQSASRSTNWLQMQRLPDAEGLKTKPSQLVSGLLGERLWQEFSTRYERYGIPPPAAAAECETKRRLMLVGVALKRFQSRHGHYPAQLTELAPEILTSGPLDFMNGQPFHYQPDADGSYQFYSVGFDQVDDGGKTMDQLAPGKGGVRPLVRHPLLTKTGDIVWPRPATEAEATAEITRQNEAIIALADMDEQLVSAAQWQQTTRHQAEVDQILAKPEPGLSFIAPEIIKASKLPTRPADPRTLLALHADTALGTSNIVTFDLPLEYFDITNSVCLGLMIDPVVDANQEETINCQRTELVATPDDSCRFIWHSYMESPGRHVLQVVRDSGLKGNLGLLGGVNYLPDFAGPRLVIQLDHLSQFSLDSGVFHPDSGVLFHARLVEPNCQYRIECLTTNNVRLRTLTGTANNSELYTRWDLRDEKGRRTDEEEFRYRIHLEFPASGKREDIEGL